MIIPIDLRREETDLAKGAALGCVAQVQDLDGWRVCGQPAFHVAPDFYEDGWRGQAWCDTHVPTPIASPQAVIIAIWQVLYEQPIEVPKGIEDIGEQAVSAFNLGVDTAMNAIREAMGLEKE